MISEGLTEIAADPSYPCVLCGFAPCSFTAAWFVNAEFGRKINVPEGKQRVFPYKLCHKCERKFRRDKGRIGPLIETAVLHQHGIDDPDRSAL